MRAIGWGRYRTEVYPSTPSAGGGAAALVPLTRQRFIDGGTVQPGLNGSVAEPFKTVAQFMASRTNVSVQDATANYVGWVMPSLAGYVENVAFPAYASTELRADSISTGASGTTITGNLTWANSGGAFAASIASLVVHNISVSGTFTITDDGGAPTSTVIFGGDEAGFDSATLGGAFDSSATAHLSSAIFYNASLGGGINGGTGAANANIIVLNSNITSGTVSAKFLEAADSFLAVSAITVKDAVLFFRCVFSAGTNPVLSFTAPSVNAFFDGPSWLSFLEAGGTRGAGTAVVVVGGYNGGNVEGAALTGASTDVSLNGVGATAGYTGENSGNHYTTSNGTPTSVTLKTGGGEKKGDTILISKTDLGANALAVKNNAAATIGTITANERGFVLAEFDGSDWVFAEGGSLAA